MSKKKIHNRLVLVLGFLLVLPLAVGFQLFRIQFWNGEQLQKLWSQKSVGYINIPAKRGFIYDDKERLLVSNSVAYNVAIDPLARGMNKHHIDTLCQVLAQQTGTTARVYEQKIARAPKGSRYVLLARNIDTKTYTQIYKLDIYGVILNEKFDRVYSYGPLAAQTLGYVNHEEKGMIGLEGNYNHMLKGRDGLQKVRKDVHGNIYAYVGATRKQPQDGYNLHTTLDAHIQAIVEEELKQGIEKTGANYGTAIVMEPSTGAIKAMANYPTFDPNRPGALAGENRRNYAIADQIEPGSTFKLITAIAAIDQGVVDSDEVITTPDDGKLAMHGLVLRDHDPLGDLTFKEVIQKSSNIATAKIARRLQKETYYQYVRNMGFGTPTNIDLPNESSGVLKKPYRWSLVTLPWMAHGYEIQATPLQIAQAYAIFANNGLMMKPYLVKKITDSQGNIIKQNRPLNVRSIAKKETFETLRPIFESVVSDSGTAPQAAIEGLPIAGKTGTAQKVKNGQYTTSYRASFVGFFPSDKPKYVCLVILDEPQTSIYGGVTAAPIFKNIASRLVSQHNDIELHHPKKEPLITKAKYVPQLIGLNLEEARSLLAVHNIPYQIKGKGETILQQSIKAGRVMGTDDTKKELVLTAQKYRREKATSNVPDLIGLSTSNAIWLLHQAGLEVHTVGGQGAVTNQFPKAGTSLKHGRRVTIRGKTAPDQYSLTFKSD